MGWARLAVSTIVVVESVGETPRVCALGQLSERTSCRRKKDFWHSSPPHPLSPLPFSFDVLPRRNRSWGGSMTGKGGQLSADVQGLPGRFFSARGRHLDRTDGVKDDDVGVGFLVSFCSR
jgi:hypothetical protein